MDPEMASVRHVLAGDWERLRELRLTSLAADPEAFGSTYAREVDQPASQWEGWAARSEDGTQERTFVLVGDDDRWLGTGAGTPRRLQRWVGDPQRDVGPPPSPRPSGGRRAVRRVCCMGD